MERPDLPSQAEFLEMEVATPAVNPFIHKINLTAQDQVKIFILSVLLAPFRLVIGLLVFFLFWPISLIRIIGLRQEQLSAPITGWRRTVPHYLVYFWSRIFFFILGFFRIRVKGQKASVSEAPFLVVAPHSSFFDAACMLPCDLPTVLSRAENLNIPVIGALLRFNQSILVHRHDAESRRKTVMEMKRRVLENGRWPQVLVFPEGTCGNKSALLRFKPGAFIAGAPVQPVLIRYHTKPDVTSWTWKGPGMFKVLWLTLSQLYTDVEVEFLPVYVPNQAEKDNPTVYANNVQKYMARALGVPATTYEFEGSQPVNVTGHLKLPLEPVIWNVHKLLKKEGFNPKPVEDYRDICEKEGWKVGLKKMASLLSMPVTSGLECMFQHYDQDKDGIIDFREVVLGLAVRDGKLTTEELLDLAFKLFDAEGHGRMTEDVFAAVLRSLLGLTSIDVSRLLREVCEDGLVEVSQDDFRKFALSHPDYRKLFITYMRPPGGQSTERVRRQNGCVQDGQRHEAFSSKNHYINGVAPSSNHTRE
ncbi:lysophospholipid acyltransferase LPCAT4 [Protopterus annectens]|uniref:lysophospholipid acyltransferase LPCAT4 n=1 Tax=Protopterus annectens TaxID=7888 RepID=UPI001CFA7442|nr:lysophospholipid acyltransferase LPCAT4 [Protopterus annectens]